MAAITRTAHFGLMLVSLLLAACMPPATGPSSTSRAEAPVLTVAAHDSFAVSEEVVTAFERANGARVQFLALGDAGEALNKIILSKDAPLADVFFGVDNTLLGRAVDAEVFEPYDSPALEALPAAVRLDKSNALIPVDTGYVTLNADRDWFAERNLPLPASVEELADPRYKDLLVVENPVTSSPGLAFLLATIAHFGPTGWADYWQSLRDNGVLIADGWTQAYYEHFTAGSGGSGDRPLVVSYTTSPPADVMFATDGRSEPASVNVNLEGAAFRQIEFVGILKGAKQPELARKWVDFMLGNEFQQDIPLQMFVYPVRPEVDLPKLFIDFASPPAEFAQLSPSEIDAGREPWLQQWSELMLR